MSEQIRPEVAAWGLASQKGWIQIDFDGTGIANWIPCPPFFPEGYDRQAWAAELAAGRWQVSGIKHRKRDVANLTAMLSAIHQDLYAAGHCHLALIHLPDPRMMPLPVQLGVWRMEGERNEELRTLAHASDPEAIDPPVVEEFSTDKLGPGLKTLHYRRGGEDGSQIHGYLNYAWRSEELETDLRLFTFCPDLSRLQQAMPDIDELARWIRIVPRDW